MFGLTEILILLAAALMVVVFRFVGRNSSRSFATGSVKAVAGVFGAVAAVLVVLALSGVRATLPVEQPTFGIVAADAEPAVWARVDSQFTANVYPSRLAAAKPLAARIRSAIDENQLLAGTMAGKEELAADTKTETIAADSDEGASTRGRLLAPDYLMLYDLTAGNSALQEFAEQLRTEFPVSEIRVAQGGLGPNAPPVATRAVRLLLRAFEEHTQSFEDGRTSEHVGGQLLCDIKTSHGSAHVSANYIQKPWVEEFDAFVSARPQKHFVVGYSGRMVSSEAEAHRLALMDAQRKFGWGVRQHVSITADESHIIDRFAQKLSRPYGDVWREAVLLDVSADRLAPAVAQAQEASILREQRRYSVAVGLMILFAVTIVLCVTLNIVTQGYYRRRLLIGIAAVVGLIVLAAVA